MHPTGNRYAGMCAVFLMLWAHGEAMAPLLMGQSHGLTTVFRGQELTYEVIDGMAVHGGDIILGTAEEADEELRRTQRGDRSFVLAFERGGRLVRTGLLTWTGR